MSITQNVQAAAHAKAERQYQSLRECKVYIIECRTRSTNPYCNPQAWEELTPGLRYSHSDLECFQDDLTLDDWYLTQYRAVMSPAFGTEQLTLTPKCATSLTDSMPRVVHHTVMAEGECLPPTGWSLCLNMLGA